MYVVKFLISGFLIFLFCSYTYETLLKEEAISNSKVWVKFVMWLVCSALTGLALFMLWLFILEVN